MGNLGTVIFNAVKKGFPLAHNGKTTMPGNLKFSLKNPYILEALPENKIDEFIKYKRVKVYNIQNRSFYIIYFCSLIFYEFDI